MSSTGLTQLSQARKALAKAGTLQGVLELRDQAEAMRVYIRAATDGFEAQNQAAELKLRAERKAGEMLAKMDKRVNNSGGPMMGPALSDLNINKNQSSRWQKEATIPEEEFNAFIDDCNQKGKEITQAATLALTNSPHISESGENEWYTPEGIIELARAVMGGIDLDPASSDIAQKTVKAKRYFTISDDGLNQNWGGRIWLNPPYSKDLIGQFATKLIESKYKQAILLVNNATETVWFQQVAAVAIAICFPSGRIRYLDSTGKPANSPLQGQAILYFGPNSNGFEELFAPVGFVLFRKVETEPAEPAIPADFETFWKEYPPNEKGRKRGKQATLTRWNKIPQKDRAECIKAAITYRREQNGEFIRDPERFLKDDWWRDMTAPVEKPKKEIEEHDKTVQHNNRLAKLVDRAREKGWNQQRIDAEILTPESNGTPLDQIVSDIKEKQHNQ